MRCASSCFASSRAARRPSVVDWAASSFRSLSWSFCQLSCLASVASEAARCRPALSSCKRAFSLLRRLLLACRQTFSACSSAFSRSSRLTCRRTYWSSLDRATRASGGQDCGVLTVLERARPIIDGRTTELTNSSGGGAACGRTKPRFRPGCSMSNGSARVSGPGCREVDFADVDTVIDTTKRNEHSMRVRARRGQTSPLVSDL